MGLRVHASNSAVSPQPRWVDRLSDEDLMFVKRLVLASGSLKQVAADYGISYPTVRLRLDRLIQRIKIFEASEIQSEFERTARVLLADGKIDLDSFKRLLAAHRLEAEEKP